MPYVARWSGRWLLTDLSATDPVGPELGVPHRERRGNAISGEAGASIDVGMRVDTHARVHHHQLQTQAWWQAYPSPRKYGEGKSLNSCVVMYSVRATNHQSTLHRTFPNIGIIDF